MAIRKHIDAKQLSDRLSNLEACANNAPDGTYEHEKLVVEFIGDTVDGILREAKALGLKTPNCDQIREVEAVIYGYLTDANPLTFAAGEGFGDSMDGPARDRIIFQAEQERDFLSNLLAGQS